MPWPGEVEVDFAVWLLFAPGPARAWPVAKLDLVVTPPMPQEINGNQLCAAILHMKPWLGDSATVMPLSHIPLSEPADARR